MFKKILRWFLAPLTTLMLAVASSQVITRGYIYSEIGALWIWSGSAQSWSGSQQAATYSDFTTYLANNGSCGGSSQELITYGVATACAVLYTLQTTGIGSTSVHGQEYSATFNPHTSLWVCHTGLGPTTASYATSSTAQPGTASFPQSISLTGLTYAGISSFTLELENPSSGVVQTWTVTGTSYTATYTGGGAKGTWTWFIPSPPDNTCDDTSGAGTNDLAAWSGTSYSWYQ